MLPLRWCVLDNLTSQFNSHVEQLSKSPEFTMVTVFHWSRDFKIYSLWIKKILWCWREIWKVL